jgi:hypothetical protein
MMALALALDINQQERRRLACVLGSSINLQSGSSTMAI